MPREMIATSMAPLTLSCQNGRDMLLQHEWYSTRQGSRAREFNGCV